MKHDETSVDSSVNLFDSMSTGYRYQSTPKVWISHIIESSHHWVSSYKIEGSLVDLHLGWAPPTSWGFWNEEFYINLFFLEKKSTDHCCFLRMSRQVRKAMNRPWLPAETLLEQSELYRSRMSSAPSDFFSIDNGPLGFVVINCNGGWVYYKREGEKRILNVW